MSPQSSVWDPGCIPEKVFALGALDLEVQPQLAVLGLQAFVKPQTLGGLFPVMGFGHPYLPAG